ncbi:glycosyltransferase [Borrelia crocidurae]|uniref:glycosyltransferase n=1 Tax=Borrelia crocidurae TaxID=29520 RepID=UPI0032EA869A
MQKYINTKKRIFFTGGGTGGHVFPGIAIISKLKEYDTNIEFFLAWKKKFNRRKTYSRIRIYQIYCNSVREIQKIFFSTKFH